MELLRLFKIDNKRISQISFSDITPKEIIERHTLNMKWLLDVQYTQDDEVFQKTINLSLMFTETIVGRQDTWVAIVMVLTNAMVDSYEIASVNIDYPNNFVGQISANNNLYFNVGYTSMKSLGETNNPSMLWRLRDIVISKNKENLDTDLMRNLDLSKCVTSINGILSRPVVFEDKLYVNDGLTYMFDTTNLIYPDIVLLNFTTMNTDIEFIPFSSCEHRWLNNYDQLEYDWYRDVEVTLPDGIDLSNKSVMCVIGHSLILHNDLNVTNNNKVFLSPYRYPIWSSILMKLRRQEEYIRNTSIIRSNELTVKNYVEQLMWEETHYGAFFIILDTPSLYITESTVASEVGARMLRTNDNLGILRKKSNWGIVDYVSDSYNNINILHLNESQSQFPMDNDLVGEQIAFDTFDCEHNFWSDHIRSPYQGFKRTPYIPNLAEAGYEMFRIIY